MTDVHLFSGLGSSLIPSFQDGTRALMDLLDDLPKGVNVHHYIWNQWYEAATSIVELSNDKASAGPVILIGHSNGVLACANIANQLLSNNTMVDYIAAIDPTLASFPVFGKNVKKVDEFWAKWGGVAIGRRVSGNKKAACHFATAWVGDHQLLKIGTGHVACAKHPEVRQHILRSVEALL